MLDKKLNGSFRDFYMCFLVVYMIVREVLPLQFLINNIFVSVFVFLAFVAFKCFPLYELLSNWHAADTRLLNLLISLGITLLFLILTLMLVHRSRKKICITADSVTWYTAEKYSKPFPKTRSLRTVFSANMKNTSPVLLFSAMQP